VLIELDQISIAEVDHFCIAGNSRIVKDGLEDELSETFKECYIDNINHGNTLLSLNDSSLSFQHEINSPLRFEGVEDLTLDEYRKKIQDYVDSLQKIADESESVKDRLIPLFKNWLPSNVSKNTWEKMIKERKSQRSKSQNKGLKKSIDINSLTHSHLSDLKTERKETLSQTIDFLIEFHSVNNIKDGFRWDIRYGVWKVMVTFSNGYRVTLRKVSKSWDRIWHCN